MKDSRKMIFNLPFFFRRPVLQGDKLLLCFTFSLLQKYFLQSYSHISPYSHLHASLLGFVPLRIDPASHVSHAALLYDLALNNFSSDFKVANTFPQSEGNPVLLESGRAAMISVFRCTLAIGANPRLFFFLLLMLWQKQTRLISQQVFSLVSCKLCRSRM